VVLPESQRPAPRAQEFDRDGGGGVSEPRDGFETDIDGSAPVAELLTTIWKSMTNTPDIPPTGSVEKASRANHPLCPGCASLLRVISIVVEALLPLAIASDKGEKETPNHLGMELERGNGLTE
jgi:hypothetical protein